MRSARAVPLTLYLSHSHFVFLSLPKRRALLALCPLLPRAFLALSRCHSLPLPRPRSFEKKRRGLRSIFITQTGRPSGAHKKCLFTYGDWSATGFGGNAEPLSLARHPSRPAPRRRRLFPARVLRFSSCPPHALSCTPLSLSPFPLFFRRGEKMRAARRLVEGTDDVVSDVPPPGLGGGDARETVVRGRAVECEHRHRRVHISRGGCMREDGRRGGWGEPQIELEILLHEGRDFGISARRENGAILDWAVPLQRATTRSRSRSMMRRI